MQISAWNREGLHGEEEAGSHRSAFLLGYGPSRGWEGLRQGSDRRSGEASWCPHPVLAAATLALSLGS